MFSNCQNHKLEDDDDDGGGGGIWEKFCFFFSMNFFDSSWNNCRKFEKPLPNYSTYKNNPSVVIEITRTKFINNYSISNGAHIFIAQATVRIQNSEFSQGQTIRGGIYLKQVGSRFGNMDSYIEKSTFFENNATFASGIYLSLISIKFEVKNTTFSGNSALFEGLFEKKFSWK